jgi:hypothetical protein
MDELMLKEGKKRKFQFSPVAMSTAVTANIAEVPASRNRAHLALVDQAVDLVKA